MFSVLTNHRPTVKASTLFNCIATVCRGVTEEVARNVSFERDFHTDRFLLETFFLGHRLTILSPNRSRYASFGLGFAVLT